MSRRGCCMHAAALQLHARTCLLYVDGSWRRVSICRGTAAAHIYGVQGLTCTWP